MDLNWVLPLIGGLGIGSILQSAFDLYHSRKSKEQDRLYSEKKEIYLGLIQQLYDSEIEPNEANSKLWGLWQNRCSLFGSNEVLHYVQKVIETNDNPVERRKILNALFEAMRKDLGNK